MRKITFIRRITVFINHTITFVPDNLQRLAAIFPAAVVAPDVPDIAPQPILAAPPIEPNDMPWYMLPWMEGGRKTQFYPNRIDIIEQLSTSSMEAEQQLVLSIVEDLKKILTGLEINTLQRLAYAPIIAVEEEADFNVSEYFAKHVVLPDFETAKPSERNINVSYHVDQMINGERRTVHLACKLSEGYKKDPQQDTVLPTLIIEPDINTSCDSAAEFEMSVVDKFFLESIKWSGTVVEHFLE